MNPVEGHPCISFFPALPLRSNLDLGDWSVGTPPEDATWRSERFKTLAVELLTSFEALGFKKAALVWHRDRGFDGSRPSDDEMLAIAGAVSFAVLDANDALDDSNRGHFMATAENAAFYVQPIDEGTESITHERGGALRKSSLVGLKIGEKPIPLPDATVPIVRDVVVSGKLARAVFGVLKRNDVRSLRVQVALEWHRAAMANPKAVTFQLRVIALKTGFEALFGGGNSWNCAVKLREHFESVTADHRDCLPWSGLLWSPKEKTVCSRTGAEGRKKKTEARTELQDWFMTLAEVRSSIIHQGVVSSKVFSAPPERPLSRYAGCLFWVGERLLREAIKGFLGPEILLCCPLARRAAWQPIVEAVRVNIAAHAGTANKVGDSDAGPSRPHGDPAARLLVTRSLDDLLVHLKCASASQVWLKKARGGVSASEDVARKMSEALRDKWEARSGSVSLLISNAERDLLETAGAEEEIPKYWYPCE